MKMLDYSDVPEDLLNIYPEDTYLDRLIECTAKIIEEFGLRLGDKAVTSLALEIHPDKASIELSANVGVRAELSDVSTWSHHELTKASGFTEIWRPVRETYFLELSKWSWISSQHAKGDSLFIYALLVSFVFNLTSRQLVGVLSRINGSNDLEIAAINYRDPNLPNIFYIENKRTTLWELTEPSKKANLPAKTKAIEDPNQGLLF